MEPSDGPRPITTSFRLRALALALALVVVLLLSVGAVMLLLVQDREVGEPRVDSAVTGVPRVDEPPPPVVRAREVVVPRDRPRVAAPRRMATPPIPSHRADWDSDRFFFRRRIPDDDPLEAHATHLEGRGEVVYTTWRMPLPPAGATAEEWTSYDAPEIYAFFTVPKSNVRAPVDRVWIVMFETEGWFSSAPTALRSESGSTTPLYPATEEDPWTRAAWLPLDRFTIAVADASHVRVGYDGHALPKHVARAFRRLAARATDLGARAH